MWTADCHQHFPDKKLDLHRNKKREQRLPSFLVGIKKRSRLKSLPETDGLKAVLTINTRLRLGESLKRSLAV